VLADHLPIVVSFVLFIGIRHINSLRKVEEVIYDVDIEVLLRLHSNLGQKFRYLRMLSSVQNRISAA
jgi:hypothetical protein